MAPYLVLVLVPVLVGLAWPSRVEAFDYLEHAYFSDRSCLEAQKRLGERLGVTPKDSILRQRYLALALMCPSSWRLPYCADDHKQAVGAINILEEPPASSGDYSMTLGDYAALPDHISRLGPVRGLPRALEDGLVERTLEWISSEPDTAGGTIEDVAEDACETESYISWRAVEADLHLTLPALSKGPAVALPDGALTPLSRAPVKRGPRDPAANYSFNNPHYLDLVLRNHHHFGAQAFAAWLGFHTTAQTIAERRCVEVLGVDGDALEDMADDLDDFDSVDFEALEGLALRQQGCAMLAEHVRRRLLVWATQADPVLLKPVQAAVAALRREPRHGAEALERANLLDGVLSSVMALVFEGSGLHFLQDGLASGHMRTTRSREALLEVRYDHDRDNREGVVARWATRGGEASFVAFGDSYLLGKPYKASRRCEWEVLTRRNASREGVTDCLIRHQRGLIVAQSAASLIDWALRAPATSASQGDVCKSDDPLRRYVCWHLPVRMPVAAGEEVGKASVVSSQGVLPVPPPPFSYESLAVRLGVDLASGAPQFGVRVGLLRELDDLAHWMTSYQIGLFATLGDGLMQQLFLDGSFHFHWRWSARFLIDAGPSVYVGLRELEDGATFFAGLAPSVGLTVLPEGWIKLPLELSVVYRLPFNMVTSTSGFFGERVIDGHFFGLGIGLAFMH